MTLLYTALGIGFMLGLAAVLARDFPPGLLQNHFRHMPWPFT